MSGLHGIDLAVLAAYLGLVLYIGWRAQRGAKSQEGFFLAGRKLGKFYQFFLNFGNATEPQGAVSTASVVYARGASGVWLNFQTVFLNPFYWFIYVWFRRARVTTVADLFEERFLSRGLSRFYALFQIGVAVLLIGVGNLTAYKITSSVMLKPEAQWTDAERATVAAHAEWRQAETQAAAGQWPAAQQPRLAALREQAARGELPGYVSWLGAGWPQWVFYLGFTAVVGAYMILGGMRAAAFNDALQGFLIVAFSVLLVPAGLRAIGGWHELAAKVSPGQFLLVGAPDSGQYGFWYIVAYTWASLVQILGLSANMGIFGSARNEYAARFGGVTGTYAKRLLIIVWTLVGLIGAAYFAGPDALSDPDQLWGKMSNQLLPPGLLGLMLAGVIAGTMSMLAAKAIAISSLFVRNLYRHLWPETSDARAVRAARWTIVAVLALGVGAARFIGGLENGIKLIIDVNVPFGAAILLLYCWRRLTAAAVWCAVLLTTLLNVVLPNTLAYVNAAATAPALLPTAPDAHGQPVPVYFAKLIHRDPQDPTGPVQGAGRCNVECYLLSHFGLDPAALTPPGRETARYFFDGLFPFAVLMLVSLVTRQTERAAVDRFYGKLQTPVGPTPEADLAALEETRRDPRRFDHKKLFPNTAWEFGRWTTEDALGFLSCCATSAVILGLMFGMLHWAAGG